MITEIDKGSGFCFTYSYTKGNKDSGTYCAGYYFAYKNSGTDCCAE